MKHLTFLLIFIPFCAFSQVTGVIRDSITGRPVSFTNIWVANEHYSATTDLEGRFTLPEEVQERVLVIYACGFEVKKITANKQNDIKLKRTGLQKPQDVQSLYKKSKKEHGAVEIDENASLFLPYKESTILAKYFPPVKAKKKKHFIKEINVLLQPLMYSDIESNDPRVRLRLFQVNDDNSLGEEVYYGDELIKAGGRKITANMEKYAIEFPNKGIFVAIEWLKMPVNIRNKANEERTEVITPGILMVPSDNPTWEFKGEWERYEKVTNTKTSYDGKYPEPAISLTLTD